MGPGIDAHALGQHDRRGGAGDRLDPRAVLGDPHFDIAGLQIGRGLRAQGGDADAARLDHERAALPPCGGGRNALLNAPDEAGGRRGQRIAQLFRTPGILHGPMIGMRPCRADVRGPSPPWPGSRAPATQPVRGDAQQRIRRPFAIVGIFLVMRGLHRRERGPAVLAGLGLLGCVGSGMRGFTAWSRASITARPSGE